MDLVRDGFKLAYAMAGQNTSDFDEKNMKLISPRFLGVVPEEKNNNDVSFWAFQKAIYRKTFKFTPNEIRFRSISSHPHFSLCTTMVKASRT